MEESQRVGPAARRSGAGGLCCKRVLVSGVMALALSCAQKKTPQIPDAELANETTKAPPELPLRLPRSVVPSRYTLKLRLDPKEDTFQGEAHISVQLTESTTRILLHGQGLAVSAATIQSAGKTYPAVFKQLNSSGLAELLVNTPLPSGAAIISIKYEAAFNNELKGLYRVTLSKDIYAFTQFEATSARTVFPCFDEPSFKASFDLTLIVPPDLVALAGTPQISDKSDEGKAGFQQVRFATTPRLPTYLLAWAVGPLDVVETPGLPATELRTTSVPLRGVATRGRGEELSYALERTPEILTALEAYFARPYPYPKLDVVAVPDFAFGAMENVGLITFREWLLMVSPTESQEGQRRAFAGVMAHELAHQWFGNLVTMDFWDEVWLNEAFATWLGTKIQSELYPEDHARLHALGQVHWTMNTDSLQSARKIRQPILSDDDIHNAFDGITYTKGGAVLEMFEQFLSADVFRDGVRKYIQTHAEGNATAEDLLLAISEVAGEDIAPAFSTFLNQTGVPLIETELLCDGEEISVAVEQSRYLPLGSKAETERLWQVPLCVRYDAPGAREADAPLNTGQECHLLTKARDRFKLKTDSCPGWIMPNADASGYYRWSLQAALLERLVKQGWGSLSVREQMSLGDAVNSAFAAGRLTYGETLDALAPLAKEKERSLVEAPMGLLQFAISHLAQDEAERQLLREQSARLYLPALHRLGWTEQAGESGEAKLLRASVVRFLVEVARDPATRRQAATLGHRYLGLKEGKLHLTPSAIPNDLVDACLRAAIQEGDEDTFEAVKAGLHSLPDAGRRGSLLSALGSVRDERATLALELALDPELRRNEVMTPLWEQVADPTTRQAAWQWFKAHFEELEEKLGASGLASSPWLGWDFCRADEEKELTDFFAPRLKRIDGGARTLSLVSEQVRLCAKKTSSHRASLTEYLQRRPQGLKP